MALRIDMEKMRRAIGNEDATTERWIQVAHTVRDNTGPFANGQQACARDLSSLGDLFETNLTE